MCFAGILVTRNRCEEKRLFSFWYTQKFCKFHSALIKSSDSSRKVPGRNLRGCPATSLVLTRDACILFCLSFFVADIQTIYWTSIARTARWRRSTRTISVPYPRTCTLSRTTPTGSWETQPRRTRSAISRYWWERRKGELPSIRIHEWAYVCHVFMCSCNNVHHVLSLRLKMTVSDCRCFHSVIIKFAKLCLSDVHKWRVSCKCFCSTFFFSFFFR